MGSKRTERQMNSMLVVELGIRSTMKRIEKEEKSPQSFIFFHFAHWVRCARPVTRPGDRGAYVKRPWPPVRLLESRDGTRIQNWSLIGLSVYYEIPISLSGGVYSGIRIGRADLAERFCAVWGPSGFVCRVLGLLAVSVTSTWLRSDRPRIEGRRGYRTRSGTTPLLLSRLDNAIRPKGRRGRELHIAVCPPSYLPTAASA